MTDQKLQKNPPIQDAMQITINAENVLLGSACLSSVTNGHLRDKEEFLQEAPLVGFARECVITAIIRLHTHMSAEAGELTILRCYYKEILEVAEETIKRDLLVEECIDPIFQKDIEVLMRNWRMQSMAAWESHYIKENCVREENNRQKKFN